MNLNSKKYLRQRIEEQHKTIELYYNEIQTLKKQLDWLTPKRDNDGKFASKTGNKKVIYDDPTMEIICDGKKNTIVAIGGDVFRKRDIVLHTPEKFKSLKITVKN